MREITPEHRAIVNCGLLQGYFPSYQKELVGRGQSMTERTHYDSFSPRRGADTTAMSHKSGIEHHNSRNSSNDPSVSSTHSRSVSSNSRVHPRASNHVSHDSKSRSHDKMGSAHDSKSRFHDHHHKTPKRKKSTGAEDESAVWTEHVSSSGRIYYYNKKEDKSQWEKPKDYIKQHKGVLVSPVSRSSRPSTISSSKQSISTPQLHSRSHGDTVNHKEKSHKLRHEQQSNYRGENRDKEHTSFSRSVSHSPSTKHQPDKVSSRQRHSRKTVTSPITPKSKPILVSPTTPVSVSQTPPQSIDPYNRNGDPSVMQVDCVEQQTALAGRHASHLTRNGPTTPGLSLVMSPQPGVIDTSGLHPLQKALLLQNQYSQQQSSDPSLCMTPQSAIPAHLSQPGSHPNSPLVQSPLTGTPPILTPPIGQSLNPVQGTMMAIPANVHVTYNPGMMPSFQAASLQTAMSRLTCSNMDGYNFPDVSLLSSTIEDLTVGIDLVDKDMAENWTQYNNPLQSQIDDSVVSVLQASVMDSMHVFSRKCLSQLRLESMHVPTYSTDIRLTALSSLMEEINDR